MALLRDFFGKSVPPDADESVAALSAENLAAASRSPGGPFVSGVTPAIPNASAYAAPSRNSRSRKIAGSIVRGMMRLAKSKKGPRAPTCNFRQGNETLVRALAKNLGPRCLPKQSRRDF